MSYIDTIDPQRAQGQLADIYKRISGARGGVAQVMQVQSLNPAAMETHFEFYKTLLFGRSELDRRTREMIGVIVSSLNNCAYCVEHHLSPLRSYGVDAEVLELLAKGQIADVLSPALRRLLRFARELTRDPKPDEDAILELRALEWSDSAILDATMITGYFNFVNRVVVGLGASLEEGFEETCKTDLESA
ncbi:MAG: putative peroxidase-related enzyme [Bradymonadia bacterium]|jgi:uncharacterized peroxidase-related enzyme